MSSYLTCTVAQAKEFNATLPHHFISLSHLLDERSVSHPDVVVAGFPELSESRESWNVVELSMFRSSLGLTAHLVTRTIS